jgi:hypothetical protein
MMPKVFFWENGRIHKVAPNQLVVPFDPLPLQLLSCKNGATILWLLVRMQSQNHGNIHFFGEVHFIIGA